VKQYLPVGGRLRRLYAMADPSGLLRGNIIDSQRAENSLSVSWVPVSSIPFTDQDRTLWVVDPRNVIRHPNHVATYGVECHQHLSLPAQPIDFKKDLAPGQVGETVRQRIQVAPMRALYCSENAISDGCMRSHDQILHLLFGRSLQSPASIPSAYGFLQDPG